MVTKNLNPAALLVEVILLAGCGDPADDPSPDELIAESTFGPSCCAIIAHGANCGWNYSSMGSWNVLFELGKAGDEDTCKTQWDEYLKDSMGTRCDGQTAGTTTAKCIDDSGVADTVLAELATPNQYNIPDEYPQFAGEIGGVTTFAFGAIDIEMESIGYGFLESSHDNYYFVSFGGDGLYDDYFTIRIRAVQQGVYTGSEDGDPARASLRYANTIFATSYGGSVTVDVKGLSDLAVWAEFGGSICDLYDTCLDISGQLSAALPDTWVH